MKRILFAVVVLLLGACSTLDGTTRGVSSAAPANSTSLLAQLAGTWDNHAQVWQARQLDAARRPAHVRQRIAAVADHADSWDWRLSMTGADGQPQQVQWRYALRRLDDGHLLLTPARALPDPAGGPAAEWAELVPCALRGGIEGGHLRMAADQRACSALLGGLGTAAALLPLNLDFDGNTLILQTYVDVARGAEARQMASRVRWYDAWVAINGAGPEARGDSKDWHTQRDVRIGNQGRAVPVRWRDGKPSGYSLRLETLDYRARTLRVLQLSLVRDADGATVAYAWADPESRHIGLNLGWLQTGLQAGQGIDTAP